jgi:hypothetical protein
MTGLTAEKKFAAGAVERVFFLLTRRKGESAAGESAAVRPKA